MKEAQTEFYPQEKFWHEMYGKLILHAGLLSSNEDRNLQYITNKLFVAAACDVAIENEKRKLKSLKSMSEEQRARLGELEKYPHNYNLEVLNNKLKGKFGQEVSGLDAKLEKGYQDLKDEIYRVRISGVQKSTEEKIITLFGNCIKAIKSVFRVPTHLAVDVAHEIVHPGQMSSSKKNLLNPARVISKLGMARDEAKGALLMLKSNIGSRAFEEGIKRKLWKKKKSESHSM